MDAFSKFFGFDDDPFKRVPDIFFYYPAKKHKKIFDTLNYLIESKESFALLIGKQGTGKTLVIQKFINDLPNNTIPIYIRASNFTSTELFAVILEKFNLKTEPNTTIDSLFTMFKEFLLQIKKQDKKAIIIIDEAQNLSCSILKDLHKLSEQENNEDSHFKILLAGKPDLIQKLNSAEHTVFKQHDKLLAWLTNIDKSEIRNYINAHIIKADKKLIKIENKVIKKIAQISKGNPLLINTLMEKAMIAAFLDNSYTVTAKHLLRAKASINTTICPIKNKRLTKIIAALSAAAMLCICIVGGFALFSRIHYEKLITTAVPSEEISPKNYLVESFSDSKTKSSFSEHMITSEKTNTLFLEEPYNVTETVTLEETDIHFTEEAEPTQPAISETKITAEATTNNSLPEETTNNLQATPQTVKVVITATSLNVRQTPNMNAKKIASVFKNDVLTVLEENPLWIKIELNDGRKGWIYKQHTKILP